MLRAALVLAAAALLGAALPLSHALKPVRPTPASAAAAAANPSLVVDNATRVDAVSADLWGIFFEEISHAGVGGLFSQLVNNSNFENAADYTADYMATDWDALPSSSASSLYLSTSTDRPLTWQSRHALRVESIGAAAGEAQAILNRGWWGMSLRNRTAFDVSFWLLSADIHTVEARIVDADDYSITYGSALLAAPAKRPVDQWHRLTATIPCAAPAHRYSGALLLTWNTTGQTAHNDVLYLDVITLYPHTADGWHGLPYIRRDLADLVAALHPSFLRMPGGGYIVGDKLVDRFEWRNTVGPVEERAGHKNPWGYYSEDQFGIYEYFTFAERLTDVWGERTRTVWVINPGIGNQDFIPAHHIEWWIRNTLDCIEFITGDASTPWGSRRAAMGRREPFQLDYLAIGNENCQFNGLGPYIDIYPAMAARVRAAYPALPLIVNCNDTHLVAANYSLYEYHTYPSVDEMARTGYHFFDEFSRDQPIFISEYSAGWQGGGVNALRNALAESIFMSGLERNAAVARLAAYAPLFAHVESMNWQPNMIYFNASHSYATPSYYNQQLQAAAARGTTKATQYTLNFQLSQGGAAGALTASVSTAAVSATYRAEAGVAADSVLIVRLTNYAAAPLAVNMSLPVLAGAAFPLRVERVNLASADGPDAINTLDDPTHVTLSPVAVSSISGSEFSVAVAGWSAVVLRVFVKGSSLAAGAGRVGGGVMYE